MTKYPLALIATIIAALAVGWISPSTEGSTIRALHLVRTAVTTCTSGDTSTVRHLAVALGRQPWSTLPIALIGATGWAWSTHWRLLGWISRHGSS